VAHEDRPVDPDGIRPPTYVGAPRAADLPACQVVDSLAAVDVDWGRLSTPAGLYQSREWLDVCERMAPGPARYVVARSEAGAPLAFLPLFLLPAADAGIYDPVASLGPELAAQVGRDPVLVVGARSGYRTGFAFDRALVPGRRPAALASLLLAADGVGAELGAEAMTLQYLLAEEAALLARTGMVDAAELVLQLCEVEVELVGRSFDDYVRSLSSRRRATVRRDVAAFAGSGLRAGRMRLSEALDFGPRLLARLVESHGGGVDEEQARAMLTSQAASLDRVSHVFVAHDDEGEVAAYSVAYEWDDVLYLRFVGLDHERAEPAGAYFEVAYYAPLRLAYEHGLSTVHLGVGSFRPKVLRGGRLRELFGAFLGREGRRLSPEAARSASARNAADLATELGDLLPEGEPRVRLG
jgi:uncharacterized protein